MPQTDQWNGARAIHPRPAVRGHEAGLIAEALRDRGVLLTGPAGIGKTRLLADALAAAVGTGYRVASMTANSAISAVPFGALMSLIDETRAASQPIDQALAVRRGIHERGIEVLAIDDAHLLDSASAGVVYELAASGLAVAVTVRSGSPVPDAISLLVKDRGVLLHEVRPLRADEVAVLAGAGLGGEVDAGLVRELADRSGGNPLALRVLISEGVESGSIVSSAGSWRLRGPLPVAREIVELMRAPVERLSSAARDAAEQVALADGLSPAVLLSLADAAVIDEAESGGVLDLGDPSMVRVGHPLIRDALLAMLPTLRRRAQLGRLIAALGRSELTVDRVAVARWRMELGEQVAVPELMELADVVLPNDPATSQLLLRAAVEHGGGWPASLRLAEVLAHQHQVDDSLAILEAMDKAELDPAALLAVELTRAFVLTMPAQQAPAALRLLSEVRDRAGTSPMLEAVTATALWLSGRLAESKARALSVVSDRVAPREARAHASLTAASLDVYDGNEREFAAHFAELRELMHNEVNTLPEGEEACLLLDANAPLYSTLDRVEVQDRAKAGYARQLARGDDGNRAQYASILARASLLAGDADEAVRLHREAAGARGVWSSSNLPFNRSHRVQALVLAGRQSEAEEVARALDDDPRNPYLEAEARVAAAAILAGRGQLRAAAETAAAAARLMPSGAAGIAALAWYEALRYGHPLAPAEFLSVAAAFPGPARAAQRAQALAVSRRDPVALEDAARGLLDAGLGGFAADAMVTAIRLYERTHDQVSVAHARERLRFIQAQLSKYDSPVARGLDRPALTERESEIARLAALGGSDREIAESLQIGVRTVETHLSRVYGKLGVGGRDELGVVLIGAGEREVSAYSGTDSRSV
ncbi:LuxR family transcriptional regulator [soil metagenome]